MGTGAMKFKFRIRTLMIFVIASALLAFIVKDRFRAYYGRFVIPSELSDFLSEGELELDFEYSDLPQQVQRVTFVPIEKLRISKFVLSTSEYYSNYNEPGEDPNAFYELEGVDLLAKIKGYRSEGVLVWFPEFQQFGCHDSDHEIMRLFGSEIGWNEIRNDLARYVNAQWYPDRVGNELLRPWGDDRCQKMTRKLHPR